jgi:phage baseplate assembly protein gpV
MNRLLNVFDPPRRQENTTLSGLVLGTVSNVDKQGRVQVTLGSFDPNYVTDWLRVASPLASSKGRAAYHVPQLQDQAVVAFVNGDPRAPVVLGFLSSTADPLPQEFTKGHSGVILGDGKPRLTLNESDEGDGPGVVINDGKGNSITIKTKGNTIEIVAAGNITLSAPDGKVSISAKTIELASSDATTLSSAKIDVKADPNDLTLKGKRVNIN